MRCGGREGRWWMTGRKEQAGKRLGGNMTQRKEKNEKEKDGGRDEKEVFRNTGRLITEEREGHTLLH